MNSRGTGNHASNIAWYCEVISYKYTGNWVKFPNSGCSKGDDCELAPGATVGSQNMWSINGGLDSKIPFAGNDDGQAAFSRGASYPYSNIHEYTTIISHSKNSLSYAKGRSGFWALVPMYIT